MPSDDPSTRRAFDALRRIVRTLRVTDRDAERKLGISVAQLFVLQNLERGTPLTINELARATVTDPSSVSVVVRRLSEKGLVRKEHAADDARRVVVTLTPTGRRLLHKSPRAPQMQLVAVLEALPSKQRAQLARTLTEVARAMGKSDPLLFFEDEHASNVRGRG